MECASESWFFERGKTSLSADAEAITDLNALVQRAVPATRAEHISLETEPELQAISVRQRAVCASFTLSTVLHDCTTRVAILEDHFVTIQSESRHAAPLDYVLDMRFLDPKPLRSRRIAWNWLSVALALLTLGVLAIVLGPRPLPEFLISESFGIALVLLLGMLGALLRFARDTTESLRFASEHGGAALINITGALGSTRRGKRFFVELMRNIRAAKAARPQPKVPRLRDEMREHHRLRELGVLSEADYEASKSRILKAHS
jgi:hypothetical protein